MDYSIIPEDTYRQAISTSIAYIRTQISPKEAEDFFRGLYEEASRTPSIDYKKYFDALKSFKSFTKDTENNLGNALSTIYFCLHQNIDEIKQVCAGYKIFQAHLAYATTNDAPTVIRNIALSVLQPK